jgi:hypothetical protein
LFTNHTSNMSPLPDSLIPYVNETEASLYQTPMGAVVRAWPMAQAPAQIQQLVPHIATDWLVFNHCDHLQIWSAEAFESHFTPCTFGFYPETFSVVSTVGVVSMLGLLATIGLILR